MQPVESFFDRHIECSVQRKAINHNFSSSPVRIRLSSPSMSTGSDTLQLPVVSVTTLVRDKNPGLNWLSTMENLLKMLICLWLDLEFRFPSSWLCSFLCWIHSTFHLIASDAPGFSQHKAKPIRGKQTFWPIISCQIPKIHHVGPICYMPTPEWITMTHWIRVDSYTLWGWESGRVDHLKQASKQKIPRNQCHWSRKREVAGEEHCKCSLHPL